MRTQHRNKTRGYDWGEVVTWYFEDLDIPLLINQIGWDASNDKAYEAILAQHIAQELGYA